MSPRAQRIAISELMGFEKIEELENGFEKRRFEFYTNDQNGYPDDSYQVGDLVGKRKILSKLEPLPDYLGDLNECHNFEDRIFYLGLVCKYEDELIRLCGDINREWNAPPERRAEAFLRTMGKWDDSK